MPKQHRSRSELSHKIWMVTGGVFLLFFSIWVVFFLDSFRERARKKAIDEVVINIQYDAKFCSIGKPLKVIISNNNVRTVKKVEFMLNAKNNRSGELFWDDEDQPPVVWSGWLKPKEKVQICQKMPHLMVITNDISLLVASKFIIFQQGQ